MGRLAGAIMVGAALASGTVLQLNGALTDGLGQLILVVGIVGVITVID